MLIKVLISTARVAAAMGVEKIMMANLLHDVPATFPTC